MPKNVLQLGQRRRFVTANDTCVVVAYELIDPKGNKVIDGWDITISNHVFDAIYKKLAEATGDTFVGTTVESRQKMAEAIFPPLNVSNFELNSPEEDAEDKLVREALAAKQASVKDAEEAAKSPARKDAFVTALGMAPNSKSGGLRPEPRIVDGNIVVEIPKTKPSSN